MDEFKVGDKIRCKTLYIPDNIHKNQYKNLVVGTEYVCSGYYKPTIYFPAAIVCIDGDIGCWISYDGCVYHPSYDARIFELVNINYLNITRGVCGG